MPIPDHVTVHAFDLTSDNDTWVIPNPSRERMKAQVFVKNGRVRVTVDGHGSYDTPILGGSVGGAQALHAGSAVIVGTRIRLHRDGVDSQGFVHIDMGDRKPKVVSWGVAAGAPDNRASRTLVYYDPADAPHVFATFHVDGSEDVTVTRNETGIPYPNIGEGSRFNMTGRIITVELTGDANGDLDGEACGTAMISEDNYVVT